MTDARRRLVLVLAVALVVVATAVYLVVQPRDRRDDAAVRELEQQVFGLGHDTAAAGLDRQGGAGRGGRGRSREQRDQGSSDEERAQPHGGPHLRPTRSRVGRNASRRSGTLPHTLAEARPPSTTRR